MANNTCNTAFLRQKITFIAAGEFLAIVQSQH